MHVNGHRAPNVGDIWENKKTGDKYEVIQIAQHANTGAYYVIYKRKGAHKDVISWAHDLSVFCENYENSEQPVSTRASGQLA